MLITAVTSGANLYQSSLFCSWQLHFFVSAFHYWGPFSLKRMHCRMAPRTQNVLLSICVFLYPRCTPRWSLIWEQHDFSMHNIIGKSLMNAPTMTSVGISTHQENFASTNSSRFQNVPNRSILFECLAPILKRRTIWTRYWPALNAA